MNLISILGRGGRPPWKWHTCTDIPAAEEYALRWLYLMTRGGNWTNKTNWLTSTTAGNWYGITVAGGHVTQINLSGNNLAGSFTGWNVAAFTALTHLWLYTNAALSGNLNVEALSTTIQQITIYSTSTTLTGSVAALTDLTYLNVQGSNTLSGSVAALTKLTYLTVTGSNTLSGSVAALTYLTTLYVTGSNTLSGSVAALTDLTYLNVTGSNTITGSVAALTDLTYLNVQGSNTLSGSVAALTKLTNLSVAGSNTLSGSVAALTKLTNLTVTGSNTITWAVGPLTKLVTLYCANNALSQATVDQIVSDLYSARAAYIAPTLTCSLGGTNAAPSGVYQNTTPPTTGKEKIYKLVVDPDNDHTTNFVVTFTA